MNLSSIKKLLNKKITIDSFNEEVASELEKYSNLKMKKGSSLPIHIIEDIETSITTNEIKVLLVLFIQKQISDVTIEYICDCLIMAEDVTYDSKVSDILFNFSSPEINGTITIDKAKKAILGI